jgi:hypothetical protein
MNTLELPLYKGSKSLTVKVDVPDSLRELRQGETTPTGHTTYKVLTAEDGDKRFAWNPRSIPEINEAKAFFDECVAQGLVPYEVDPTGNKSPTAMSVFSPTAGEVIFSPVAALAGG